MKSLSWLLAASQLFSAVAFPCATDSSHHSDPKQWAKYFKERTALAQKRKPASSNLLPSRADSPWGGEKDYLWTPEAVLANAVSEELNRGWAEEDVREVLVAAPVKMLNSSAPPYGDGQTNSAVKLGWEEKRPALVATLITYEGRSRKLRLKFHEKLQGLEKGVEMQFGDETHEFGKGQRVPSGGVEFEWEMKSGRGPEWGDLFSNEVAFVHPKGWSDWFPIDFRDVVKSQEELMAQVPKEKRKLGPGSLLDPENVSVQGKSGPAYPFLAMGDPNFGKDINADRYFPVPGSGIHNEFPPFVKDPLFTAVGHGNTLVMEKAPAPFKLAYICFDARNEKEERTHHVPSGGGWHEVGDAAETVFNSLERSPVLFGYANGLPAAKTPSGTFSYGLSDIAVFRLLQPGDALVTIAGETTLRERREGKRAQTPTNAGRNYHWFAFHQTHDVCAVEWVHPCVPTESNNWGLVCK